jgi:hypothetical protein
VAKITRLFWHACENEFRIARTGADGGKVYACYEDRWIAGCLKIEESRRIGNIWARVGQAYMPSVLVHVMVRFYSSMFPEGWCQFTIDMPNRVPEGGRRGEVDREKERD